MQFSLKIKAVVTGSSKEQLLHMGSNAPQLGWWGQDTQWPPWPLREQGRASYSNQDQPRGRWWLGNSQALGRSEAKLRHQVWWPGPGRWVAGYGHGHGCGAVLGKGPSSILAPKPRQEGFTDVSPSSFSHSSFPEAWYKGTQYQGRPWGQAAKGLGNQRQQRLLLLACSPCHFVPLFSVGTGEIYNL